MGKHVGKAVVQPMAAVYSEYEQYNVIMKLGRSPLPCIDYGDMMYRCANPSSGRSIDRVFDRASARLQWGAFIIAFASYVRSCIKNIHAKLSYLS